jgi:hypothetical protein
MSSAGHLVRRFAGSLRPGGPGREAEAWVRSVLSDAEHALWRRMSGPDRRHAHAVARRVAAALGDDATPPVLAAALLHDVGRIPELSAGPVFKQTDEGRLLGHVHLGLRMIEERAEGLDAEARTELLHAVACHHDARAARTAEAGVLYHANQLDAIAATRPVE